MKTKDKVIIFVLIILLVALFITIVFTFKEKTLVNNKKIILQNLTEDPLSIEDYIKVDINLTSNAVVLKNNCKALIISTDEIQLFTINQGLVKKIDFRPLPHDVMKEIFDNFNIEVLMLKIFDLQNGSYFSSLVLKQENKILSVETRPSDGIAIAIRTDAPIYIKKDIFEKNSVTIC